MIDRVNMCGSIPIAAVLQWILHHDADWLVCNRRSCTSVQVVPLPYVLRTGALPLTYPLLVPLTLKAWEGLSVRGSP